MITHFVIEPEVHGDELPYRVQINTVKAAGVTLVAALMRALEMTGEVRRGTQPIEAARHLFWRYDSDGNPAWAQAIAALEGSR
ncbi:hypothetical protein LCGC14_0921020 [marine sediment metagenome]|uniref:Uncharacterized protein n=1 Tax=marine sediment metagenome TaxID=412755 RepID=A0A0F9RXH8_9ZZZZ